MTHSGLDGLPYAYKFAAVSSSSRHCEFAQTGFAVSSSSSQRFSALVRRTANHHELGEQRRTHELLEFAGKPAQRLPRLGSCGL